MNGVPVARILGFEIRLPLSWIFIVAIVTVSVASRLTAVVPGSTDTAGWIVGLGASLLFLGSVIVHELAHAVVARRDGAETRVLVVAPVIGSAAAIDVIASSPRAEALIAIAGPLASGLLAAAAFGLAFVVAALGPATEPITDTLLILAALDMLVAVVSLVPAFPLDGARLVRAAAWARTGDKRRGTRTAGVVGRYVGRICLVSGFAVIIVNPELMLDGVVLGLAGWFLMASARSVDRWLVLDELIQGMSVGEAMEPDLSTISPQLTLDTFATGVLDGSVTPALPVLDADEVVGIVGAAQVRAVARRNWSSTRTAEVMVGPPEMPTARAEDRLADALESLRRSHLDGLPVLDGSTLRGVLTRRSIAALLHARAESRGQAL
jgi:Zn-dependent protease/predicted transcriptional regulator